MHGHFWSSEKKPIHIYYQCWIIHFIGCVSSKNLPPLPLSQLIPSHIKLVLLWAQLTKIYPPPLPTSVQPISITKTSRIVPTKNERDPPLFTDKLLIKFQNILRNTTQVIIWHRVKILFSVISSPITLERKSLLYINITEECTLMYCQSVRWSSKLPEINKLYY